MSILKLTEKRICDPLSGKYKTVYKINNKKPFMPISEFEQDVIKEVFDFAYGMSFGKKENIESIDRAVKENGRKEKFLQILFKENSQNLDFINT